MARRLSASRRSPSRIRFAVVVSRFNDFITNNLLEACLDEFSRLGVSRPALEVVSVPGAFELPVTALLLARKKNIEAVICLGAVIKGQTAHYELVAAETARGLQSVALATGKPVVFEVLVADTIELCAARARKGDRDNKGACAARTAFEMGPLLKGL